MKNILSQIKNNLAKEKLSIGLDIGTSQVKVVKMLLSKDRAELDGFAIEPSQLDSGDLLKRILEGHNADSVNISVSGQQTIIRYVNFPRMSNPELKQALKFEAQKHIPFSMAEVHLDGYILKDDLPDNKMLVLIAAAKKDLVSQRLKLIEGAGFRSNLVDVDSVALVNAFNYNYPYKDENEDKALALLNIGSSVSNLNILEAGLPRLSRDMHIAGNSFTQKIADILGIDFAKAEALKINPDNEKLNKIKAAVESSIAGLAGEIRTSFDYYESQGTSSVSKIYLSGGGAKFRDLKDMLSHFLNIEVDYWDPFKNINLKNNVDSEKVKNFSREFAVAVGLSLRSS